MIDDADAAVLILDDEPLATRAVSALLQAETSWEVAAFNNAAAALGALEQRTFDAVVSDFLMPDMDGLAFLTRVKQQQPAASRVLLTGYADKKNAIRSINEVGLYHYLEKPWDNDDLLLVLRNGVERARLIRKLDEVMRQASHRDRSLDELRARLFKTII